MPGTDKMSRYKRWSGHESVMRDCTCIGIPVPADTCTPHLQEKGTIVSSNKGGI